MSLASVLQTAASGMSAAVVTLKVASNNLANPRTNGFKQSRQIVATSPVPGTVELSNTDVGRNLVDLLLASNNFRANGIVFSTADDLLGDLTHLRRQS